MTFDKDLLFNGSKVKDPTACKAIMEAEKMKYMRGEIYEAESKAGGNMYVLVVSADFRGGDEMLSIIKLLTDQKGPDDVAISCHGIRYASPRAVQYIFRPSILNFVRMATEEEMNAVNVQIARYLGLDMPKEIVKEKAIEKPAEVAEDHGVREELIEAKTEAKIYKDLYERLIAMKIS